MLKILAEKLIRHLAPQSCLLCLTKVTGALPVCHLCEKNLPWLEHYCQHCGYHFIGETSLSICGQCSKNTSPISCFYGLWHYQDPIDQWIQQIKYHHQLIPSAICSEYMLRKIPGWYSNRQLPEALIPMPLHSDRLVERGYNQAIEIARPLAKVLQRPLLLHDCKRSQYTKPQATLPAPLRQKNVKDAFTIKDNFHFKHVAIVDDVYTSGSTVTALCQSLRKNGTKTIDIWCCARAQLTHRFIPVSS